MLKITGLLLLIATAAIPAVWWTRRFDSLGRERPFPWISTVLLLGLAVAALTPVILRARLENRLETAAATITGTPVEVRCQGFGEAFVDAHADLGWVAFGADGTPERATLIKRNQCRDLADYLRSDRSAPSRKQIIAVHVLTHEAIHMQGVTNEAETECLAMQNDVAMAEALGAPAEAARALAVSYWTDIYDHMPAAYRSSECRPGGKLDIGAPGAPWDN